MKCKLKKLITVMMAAMVCSIMLCACGNNSRTPVVDTQTEEKDEEDTGNEDSDQSNNRNHETGSRQSKKENILVGKLDEVKDHMFVVKTKNGDFSFPISNGAPDLSGINVGDGIEVVYKGEVSEVDAFTGEIVLVNKISMFNRPKKNR